MNLVITLREAAEQQENYATAVLLNLAANKIEELENDNTQRTKECGTED